MPALSSVWFKFRCALAPVPPLLIIGSLILMFNTSPRLALTMIPLLLITSTVIMFVQRQDGTRCFARILFSKLDSSEYSVSGKHRRSLAWSKHLYAHDFETQHFDDANQDLTRSYRERDAVSMSSMSPALTVFINYRNGPGHSLGGGLQRPFQGDISRSVRLLLSPIILNHHDTPDHDDPALQIPRQMRSHPPNGSTKYWIPFRML